MEFSFLITQTKVATWSSLLHGTLDFRPTLEAANLKEDRTAASELGRATPIRAKMEHDHQNLLTQNGAEQGQMAQ